MHEQVGAKFEINPHGHVMALRRHDRGALAVCISMFVETGSSDGLPTVTDPVSHPTVGHASSCERRHVLK